MLQRLVFALVGPPIDLFYRRWQLGGSIPADGPLLIVANHPNGLIDPVLAGRLARRPLRFLAKAPLLRTPLLGPLTRWAGALPVYRAQDGADTALNDSTFDAVFEALARGEAVCLFPEGLTHDEPSLQRMKTGAARMALGAEAQNAFGLGVRILPVGLVYSSKTVFRSKVATWVGTPIHLSPWQAAYAADDRAAVKDLTAAIEAGLRDVTVNLDRWEDLPLLALAERLWTARGGSRVVRLHAFAEGLDRVRAAAPDRVELLEQQLGTFAGYLDRLGVRPGDLELRYSAGGVARFVAYRLATLVIGGPLAVAGALLWLPAYALVRAALAIGRPEREVEATFKLLSWLALGLVAWGAHIALGAYGFQLRGAIGAALISPWLGLCALRFFEHYRAALTDARVFARVFQSRPLARRLRQRADELAAEIEALAALLPATADASTSQHPGGSVPRSPAGD